nr:zinc finger protein ZFP2-like [Anolis sagrei ordinatus]
MVLNTCGGINCPDLSISVFHPEGQVKTEAGLVEGLLDCRVVLHRLERTLSQADQQTTFWQVLQEEEQGGSAQAFGEGEPTSSKVEASQHELEEELEEGPGTVPLVNQGNGPLTAKTCEERRDEMGCWNKMEIPQQVESSPAEASQRSLPMVSNIPKRRYQLRGLESKKLVETERKHTKSVIGGDKKASTDMGKPLFSKCGRKYHNVSDGFAALNPRKKGAECPEDGERSKSHRHSLQRSQNVPTGRKLQKCATSDNDFESRGHLSSHQQSHTGQKPHQCSQDEKRIHTGEKPYKCSQCGKCFTLRHILKVHQRIHTGEKPYNCSQCGKSFAKRNTLKRHQKLHTGEKPYKCSQCGKCFTLRHNLKVHQRIHTGDKPYKCSQCGKSFAERNTLKRHQRLHTGEKPYKCSQCGKCFTLRHILKVHQRIHTGEKPYNCSQCGKSFAERNTLKRHQILHTGEKPYKCSQCGKCFTLRHNLKVHQGIHIGVKPYTCSQCGKCFTQRTNLKAHQRLHTGEKPYKCSQCGRSFTQRKTLKKHQTIHTGEKPY